MRSMFSITALVFGLACARGQQLPVLDSKPVLQVIEQQGLAAQSGSLVAIWAAWEEPAECTREASGRLNIAQAIAQRICSVPRAAADSALKMSGSETTPDGQKGVRQPGASAQERIQSPAGPRSIRFRVGSPGMVTEYIKGRRFLTVESAGLLVSASLYNVQSATVAAIVVGNRTGQSYDVLPEQIHLFQISPKARQIPQRASVRMNGPSALDRAVSGVLGGLDGYLASSPGGNPDMERRSQERHPGAEFILRPTLRANTVRPGEHLSGFLLFDRDSGLRKFGAEAILRVDLNEIMFEFPFSDVR